MTDNRIDGLAPIGVRLTSEVRDAIADVAQAAGASQRITYEALLRFSLGLPMDRVESVVMAIVLERRIDERIALAKTQAKP